MDKLLNILLDRIMREEDKQFQNDIQDQIEEHLQDCV